MLPSGNQRYTKIIKRRDQSLRRFPVLYFQEDNVIRVYEALEEHICINLVAQHFRELLNYSYIGRHNRASRSQSLFSIRLNWNGIRLTNNKVKGRGKAFASLVASLQRELSLIRVKSDFIQM
ncbi:hypothetical protein HZS_6420 [Henneguya salminicola]|nr:hypothetical protein HZS_6420 [Henneguya salminicola]